MRHLLEEFWYGNLSPQEQSAPCDGEFGELKRLLASMGKNRDMLCETLTEEQKAALATYDDSINELHSVTERNTFVYAFRLGSQMMMETLMENE